MHTGWDGFSFWSLHKAIIDNILIFAYFYPFIIILSLSLQFLINFLNSATSLYDACIKYLETTANNFCHLVFWNNNKKNYIAQAHLAENNGNAKQRFKLTNKCY